MGKRKKSSRKPGAGKVKTAPLDKTFRCLFCQHHGVVMCKMDKSNAIGRLDCRNCGQSFSSRITHLSEPIDVYSEWIDACEEVNPNAQSASPTTSRRPLPSTQSANKRRSDKTGGGGSGAGKGGRRNRDDDEEDEEGEGDEDVDDDLDGLPEYPRRAPVGDSSGDKGRGGGGDEEEEEEEEDYGE